MTDKLNVMIASPDDMTYVCYTLQHRNIDSSVEYRGVARGGAGGMAPKGMAPQSSIEWIFLRIKLALLGRNTVLSTRSVLWALNMPEMRWQKGLRPDPAGGAHDAPPVPLVGQGGGHPSPIPIPLGALMALSFCGHQCKIPATPLVEYRVDV